MLDELDKELEARGHSFVRYADDHKHLCKERESRPTGEGKYHGIHREEAETKGKPSKDAG